MKAVFVVFLFLVLFLLPGSAFAQERMITFPPSPTPTKAVTYDMPYPGLLPDSPLYIIKTTRDQIIGFLISDPYKKASFDLLQSDKRFQAGIMLYQKKPSKKDLVITTISKGQNYLDDAISKVAVAKRQKVETGDLNNKMYLSIKKQEQVLGEIGASDTDLRQRIKFLQEKLINLEKKVSILRKPR
jgi:hypothetical protein